MPMCSLSLFFALPHRFAHNQRDPGWASSLQGLQAAAAPPGSCHLSSPFLSELFRISPASHWSRSSARAPRRPSASPCKLQGCGSGCDKLCHESCAAKCAATAEYEAEFTIRRYVQCVTPRLIVMQDSGCSLRFHRACRLTRGSPASLKDGCLFFGLSQHLSPGSRCL